MVEISRKLETFLIRLMRSLTKSVIQLTIVVTTMVMLLTNIVVTMLVSMKMLTTKVTMTMIQMVSFWTMEMSMLVVTKSTTTMINIVVCLNLPLPFLSDNLLSRCNRRRCHELKLCRTFQKNVQENANMFSLNQKRQIGAVDTVVDASDLSQQGQSPSSRSAAMQTMLSTMANTVQSKDTDDDLLDDFIAKRLKGADPTGGTSTAADTLITLDGDTINEANDDSVRLPGDKGFQEITVNENGELVFETKSNSVSLSSSSINDKRDNDDTRCCVCYGCACSCHVLDEHALIAPDVERPIDSYVVYLFDYELFTVPQNYNKFEILFDYLNEEGIFDRSYVVSVTTDTRRDDYSYYVRGDNDRGVDGNGSNKGSGIGSKNTIESKLERSEVDVNVLRYRPSIVESIDETRNDIRQRFRGLIVQGSRYDWFTVKSVLNYPSFLLYVRVLNSKNNLSFVDHTIVVDPSHKTFISSPGTQGLKVARILAHTRTKYFGIEHFNFTHLLEQANLRIIQRAATNKK